MNCPRCDIPNYNTILCSECGMEVLDTCGNVWVGKYNLSFDTRVGQTIISYPNGKKSPEHSWGYLLVNRLLYKITEERIERLLLLQ